uniref:Thymus, brain and testes associated n=1 Tax=Electrophorus electricus TaxID=8005 RepID=A0AAY5ECK2_ELEEL
MFWPISAAANHTEVCVSQVMESGGDGQTAPPNASGLEPAAVGNPARVIADFPKVTTRGSARFGTLSLNSFFSRHNPHPHRVTHMSGETRGDGGRTGAPGPRHTAIWPRQVDLPELRCLLSEAWREELKDLAAKVSQPASGPKEEAPRRKTQYSAQTGRLIPASSWGAKRRDTQASHRRPGTRRPQPAILGGQELRVLELLCQILQTDSLSLVQKWLLLAGDRGETQKGDDLCTVTLCVQATEIQESSQPRSRKHTVESSPNTNYFQRPPYQCFWVFLNINLYTQICDV